MSQGGSWGSQAPVWSPGNHPRQIQSSWQEETDISIPFSRPFAFCPHSLPSLPLSHSCSPDNCLGSPQGGDYPPCLFPEERENGEELVGSGQDVG